METDKFSIEAKKDTLLQVFTCNKVSVFHLKLSLKIII